jgi:hypothetical protein
MNSNSSSSAPDILWREYEFGSCDGVFSLLGQLLFSFSYVNELCLGCDDSLVTIGTTVIHFMVGNWRVPKTSGSCSYNHPIAIAMSPAARSGINKSRWEDAVFSDWQ